MALLVIQDARQSTQNRYRSVVTALTRHACRLPEALRQSLTWDSGTEMAQHEVFSLATDVDAFSCDRKSSWQRGSNKNSNGLLRLYFPKGTSLADITQSNLGWATPLLSQRPRKTLGYYASADILQINVASTY